MGGEFYLCTKPHTAIDPTAWKSALQEIIGKLTAMGCASDHTFTTDPSQEYAFEFVDSCASWEGPEPTPKSFRLKWNWGEDAIQSHLGGRRRGDWRIVRFVCEHLCSKFPGKLALVVCDGFSGYNDDEGDKFCDGTSHGYRNLDYNVWPWANDIGD